MAFAVVKSDGSVQAWGDQTYGGADPGITSGALKVFSTSYAFAALMDDGTIKTWGTHGTFGTAPTDAVDVFASSSAFSALKADGSITCWLSQYHCAGVPTDDGYVKISSTASAFAALKTDGSIKAWGYTGYGNTGEPTGDGYVDISATGSAFAALKSDGSVAVWGNTDNGGSDPVITGVTKIVGNKKAFAALKSDGSVVAWGDAAYGNTAPTLTDVIDIFAQKRTGSAFAALKSDGSVVVWGNTANGGTNPNIGAGSGVTKIVANGYAFAALKSDGSVQVWGKANSGGTNPSLESGVADIYGTDNLFLAVGPLTTVEVLDSSGGSKAVTRSECKDRTLTCAAGAEMTAMDSFNDNTCTNCTAGKYKGQDSANACLDCAAGNNVFPPVGGGTQCLSCNPETSYDHDGNSATGCATAKQTCDKGFKFFQTDPLEDNLCIQCEYGTFQANDGSAATSCTSHNACGAGTVEITSGTTETDNVCRCAEDYYVSSGVCTACSGSTRLAGDDPSGADTSCCDGFQSAIGAACTGYKTTCNAGETLQEDGTATSDKTCAPCSDGTFKASASPGPCQPYDVTCPDNEELTGGSATAEPTCSACPADKVSTGGAACDVCPANEYLHVANTTNTTRRRLSTVYNVSTNKYEGTSCSSASDCETQCTADGACEGYTNNGGGVQGWGPAYYGGSPPTGLSGVVEIFTTKSAFAALKSDGSVQVWGVSSYGGDNNDVASLTGVTKIFSTNDAFAALKSDGSVKAWGDSNHGGDNNDVASLTGVTKIFSTNEAFAALKDDGSVKVWGDNYHGGSNPYISSGIVEIFSNDKAFAALMTDGSVDAWGDSSSGGGSTSIGAGSSVTTIASTAEAFAALMDDGSVKVWGHNSYGGRESDVAGLTNVVTIYSSHSTFAALKTDGSVKVWGSASDPDITSGVTKIFSNTYAFAALKDDGSVQVWGSSSYGGSDPSITSGVVTIFSTERAFAALKTDGSVKAWGDAGYGGSDPSITSGVSTIVSNTYTFAALMDDGSVKAWGSSTFGGADPGISGVTKIFSNHYTFAAITNPSLAYGPLVAGTGDSFVKVSVSGGSGSSQSDVVYTTKNDTRWDGTVISTHETETDAITACNLASACTGIDKVYNGYPFVAQYRAMGPAQTSVVDPTTVGQVLTNPPPTYGSLSGENGQTTLLLTFNENIAAGTLDVADFKITATYQKPNINTYTDEKWTGGTVISQHDTEAAAQTACENDNDCVGIHQISSLNYFTYNGPDRPGQRGCCPSSSQSTLCGYGTTTKKYPQCTGAFLETKTFTGSGGFYNSAQSWRKDTAWYTHCEDLGNCGCFIYDSATTFGTGASIKIHFYEGNGCDESATAMGNGKACGGNDSCSGWYGLFRDQTVIKWEAYKGSSATRIASTGSTAKAIGAPTSETGDMTIDTATVDNGKVKLTISDIVKPAADKSLIDTTVVTVVAYTNNNNKLKDSLGAPVVTFSGGPTVATTPDPGCSSYPCNVCPTCSVYTKTRVSCDKCCVSCDSGTASAPGGTCQPFSCSETQYYNSTHCLDFLDSCPVGEQLTGGHAFEDKTCSACPDGTFKATNGSDPCANQLDTCVAGQQLSGGSASEDKACVDCPTGTFNTGGPTCANQIDTCINDYELVGGSTSTDKTCSVCPGNLQSTGGATCRCPPDNRRDGSSCFSCNLGEISDDGVTCVACVADEYRDDRTCKTRTLACPAGETLVNSDVVTDNSCVKCLEGTYKSLTDDSQCLSCDYGSYIGGADGENKGGKSCTPCVEATEYDHDENPHTGCVATNSTCPAGQQLVNFNDNTKRNLCENCPAGTFKASAGAEQCQPHTVCLAANDPYSIQKTMEQWDGTVISIHDDSGDAITACNADSACVGIDEVGDGLSAWRAIRGPATKVPGDHWLKERLYDPETSLVAHSASVDRVCVCAENFISINGVCQSDSTCIRGAGDDKTANTTCCAVGQYNGVNGECKNKSETCDTGHGFALSNSKSLDNTCSACESGKFSLGGAVACDAWYECSSTQTESVAPSSSNDRKCLCNEDTRVSNGGCVACVNRVNAAGDDPLTGDTQCDCLLNEYVSSNQCANCTGSDTRPAGDDPMGQDTHCTVVCAANQRVKDNQCVTCASGLTNGAGDTNENGDTYCEGTAQCANDQKVVDQECVSCDQGKHNNRFDNRGEYAPGLGGRDTTCDWNTCAKDEYANSLTCVACVSGFNNAGDSVETNTICDDVDSCDVNEHVSYVFVEHSGNQITHTEGYSNPISNLKKAKQLCIEDSTCAGVTKDKSTGKFHLSNGGMSSNGAYDAYAIDRTKFECVACPGSSTRPAGDIANITLTQCTFQDCNVDQSAKDYVCSDCTGGLVRSPASNPMNDFICTMEPCNQNERVGAEYRYDASTNKYSGSPCSDASDCEGKCTSDGACAGYTNTPPAFNMIDIAGASKSWYGLEMSGDGQTIVAAGIGTNIWTSTDGGANWNEDTSVGATKSFFEVAMSNDGKYVVVSSGHESSAIYYSTDSGSTFAKKSPSLQFSSLSSLQFKTVAISDDGQTIAAAASTAYGVDGRIMISTDGGGSWNERGSLAHYNGIHMSGDGTKMIACAHNDRVYVSDNSGTSWTTVSSFASSQYRACSMSADGSKMIVENNRNLHFCDSNCYTSSGNWAKIIDVAATPIAHWTTISRDGSTIIAGGGYTSGRGKIYTSTDDGDTWTTHTVANTVDWRNPALSADGSIMAIAPYGDNGIWLLGDAVLAYGPLVAGTGNSKAKQTTGKSVCTPCPAGFTNEAGDTDEFGNTHCDPTFTCGKDEYASNFQCLPCALNTFNNAGDNPAVDSTCDDVEICDKNEYPNGSTCLACPGQGTRDGGELATVTMSMTDCTFPDCQSNQFSSGDGVCQACPPGRSMTVPISPLVSKECLCAKDQYADGSTCSNCPTGFTNEAGDDPSGSATLCDKVPCAVGEKLTGTGHTQDCQPCAAGTSSLGGFVTECVAAEYCLQSQKVAYGFAASSNKYGGASCSSASDCNDKCAADGACAGYTNNGGSVQAWGKSTWGGSDPGITSGVVEIFSTNTAFAALKSDGSVQVWGKANSGGTDPGITSGVTKIFSTNYAFAALKDDGSVTVWGGSFNGGTDPGLTSGVTEIFSTGTAFAALKTDGSVTVWGDSDYGGTDPGLTSGVSTIFSNDYAFAALKDDGSVTVWGKSDRGGTDPGLTSGVTEIFSAGTAFAALKDDGSVKAWGYYSNGGTDPGITSGVTKIFSTGTAFAALKTDGSVTAWGDTGSGGTDPGITGGVVTIFSNENAFAALKTDGSVTAWGNTGSGGTDPGITSGVTDIVSTWYAFAALKDDGSVQVWGRSAYGGTDPGITSGVTKIFSTGQYGAAFAALKGDGSVQVWGNTDEGGTDPGITSGVTTIFSTGYAFAAIKNPLLVYGPLVAGTGNSIARTAAGCVDCPAKYENDQRTPLLGNGTVNTCVPRLCLDNEYSDGSLCQSCEQYTGAASAGINPTDVLTTCSPMKCGENQYVENHECKNCDISKEYRAAGDHIFGGDTHCFCKDNSKVVNGTCYECEEGSSNPNMCYSGLQDHYCTCIENYFVNAGLSCEKCPGAATNAAGDYPGFGQTHCTCGEGQRVQDNACVLCGVGRLRAAGDDASGANTECSCAFNEYVSSGVCLTCPENSERQAQDFQANGDTTCTCKEGFKVSGGACVAVEAGGSRAAGDPLDGGDTFSACDEGYHVQNNLCVICPQNQGNPAGNDATGGNTTCTCLVNHYSNGNGTCSSCTSGVMPTLSDPFTANTCLCEANKESDGSGGCNACDGTESSVPGEACKCKENYHVGAKSTVNTGLSGVRDIDGLRAIQQYKVLSEDGTKIAGSDLVPTTVNPTFDGGLYSACTFDTVMLPGVVQEVTEAGFNDYSATQNITIEFDDKEYNLCTGDTSMVSWNGEHNIQEVTEVGYNVYNTSEHIGAAIHGFENASTVKEISGLEATGVRYFVCTLHPSAKFKTVCNGNPLHIGSTINSGDDVISTTAVRYFLNGAKDAGFKTQCNDTDVRFFDLQHLSGDYVMDNGRIRKITGEQVAGGHVNSVNDMVAVGDVIYYATSSKISKLEAGTVTDLVSFTGANALVASGSDLYFTTDGKHCVRKYDGTVSIVYGDCGTAGVLTSPNVLAVDAAGVYVKKDTTTLVRIEDGFLIDISMAADPLAVSVSGQGSNGPNFSLLVSNDVKELLIEPDGCTSCAPGSLRAAGDDKSVVTACTASVCNENERVVSKACQPCISGMLRAAGDLATGADTACVADGQKHTIGNSGAWTTITIQAGTTHTFERNSTGNNLRIADSLDGASLTAYEGVKDTSVAVITPAGPGTLYYIDLDNANRYGIITVEPKPCVITGSHVVLTEPCQLSGEIVVTGPLTIEYVASRLRSGATLGTTMKITAKGGRHFRVNGGSLTLKGIELTGGSAAEGGAILVENGNIDLDNVKLSENTASGEGGAIRVKNSASNVKLSNVLFDKNVAPSGGAMSMDDMSSEVDIQRATFTNNKASQGDGGAIKSNARMKIQMSVFDDNEAPAGGGGGIYTEKDVNMTGSQMKRNKANNGGAMKTKNNAVHMSLTTMEDNEATSDGGAIDSENTAVDIETSTIKGNKAKIGGAVRSIQAGCNFGCKRVSIRESSVENNEAEEGAALDVDGGANDRVEIWLQDSTLTGNTITKTGGKKYKKRNRVKIRNIDSTVEDLDVVDKGCPPNVCDGKAHSSCRSTTVGTSCVCDGVNHFLHNRKCTPVKTCPELDILVTIKNATETSDRLCGTPDVANIAYVLDDKGKQLASLVEARLIQDGVSADAAYAMALQVFGETNKCE